MIDSINKLYIKHSGNNAKLRIFSFIPQRQRIQPNFMTDSITTFIHTKQQTQPEQPKQRNQTYKRNLNNQNNEINVGFTSKTKFILLQLRQRKLLSIYIQTLQ